MNSIEHFIDGKILKGSSKRTAKVFNPATGEASSNVNLQKKLFQVGQKKLHYLEPESFLNFKN